ncbi:thioredoxin family protein [Vagococcus sp.]|uniref:thioredoxin family protein n=1 Tax=Vagococcus sp. TaxID=1933889 RepID=UPI003F9A8AE6
MFKQIKKIEEVKNEIKNNPLVFAYFGQPNCSVCHGLKPQVEKKFANLEEEVTFIEINTLETPEVAGEYQVMTVPVILLFVEGQEYLRRARIIPLQDLEDNVLKIVKGYLSLNEEEEVSK